MLSAAWRHLLKKLHTKTWSLRTYLRLRSCLRQESMGSSWKQRLIQRCSPQQSKRGIKLIQTAPCLSVSLLRLPHTTKKITGGLPCTVSLPKVWDGLPLARKRPDDRWRGLVSTVARVTRVWAISYDNSTASLLMFRYGSNPMQDHLYSKEKLPPIRMPH